MSWTSLALLAAATCLLAAGAAAAGYRYRDLGSVAVENPSFVELLQCGSSPPSLWITAFSGSPFSSGKVFAIANVSSYTDFSSADVATVSSGFFKWPNRVSTAPREIGDFIVVPDGFLVPGKSTGGIYFLGCDPSRHGRRQTASTPIELTTRKEGWFYHMVAWRDMNGDGRLDALTARAHKPLIGEGEGELLWLEQPASAPLTSVPWKEHVVVSGPDVIILPADLDPSDDQFEVFACEFFAKKLSVVTLSTKDGSLVAARDIDLTIGPAYVAIMVDLNEDGRQELVVTNHKGGSGGEVYAYTIPADVIKGNYARYLLASNFTVTEPGSNQYAPGYVYTFRPNTDYTGRPYLLLAGDGSQRAYVMEPTDTDFAYTTNVLFDAKGVVGTVGYGNGLLPGGWAELFVPDYDGNTLHAFAAEAGT